MITQLFFEVPVFNDWVKRCREAGITAHLLPGIMPILGYDKFMKMQKFTNTKVSQYVWDKLEELKQDDEAVRKFGVEVGVQMGKELMESGTRILHWYTMNLEKSVIEIINKLGIVDAQKPLPFRKPSLKTRENEEVRPIFWAIKPKSYI